MCKHNDKDDEINDIKLNHHTFIYHISWSAYGLVSSMYEGILCMNNVLQKLQCHPFTKRNYIASLSIFNQFDYLRWH